MTETIPRWASDRSMESGRRLSESLSKSNVVATLAVFSYWILYENVVFFYANDFGGSGLLAITNVLKLGVPVALLLYVGVPAPRLITRGAIALYLAFFCAFLLWLLVPTMIDGELSLWLKLIPHLLLFIGVVSLFTRAPASVGLFCKCYVTYVLLALAQYVALYATSGWESRFETPNGFFAGPYGLLGNATGVIFFPGATLPFVRLTGFWNEPSNASGSAFAACFLALYLVRIGASPRWRLASMGCFIAGLAAMSNAGYLALAGGLLAGAAFSMKRGSYRIIARLAVAIPFVVLLVAVPILGRSYVAENLAENPWARAITGLRDVERQRDNPTGERTDILRESVSTIARTFIGLGMQEVGPNSNVRVSASAPIYWLLMAGIPGILLLLARESVLLTTAFRLGREWPITAPLFQALTVVMIQHTSYGSWMNPNYLVLAAAVLVLSAAHSRETFEMTPRAVHTGL